MKFNKPWTGPWKVIKQLREVVYRIKYVGKNKVCLKRRIVHYNQLKKFCEPEGSQEAQTVDLEETSEHSATDDGNSQENAEDVIVVDGPVGQQAETQENEVEPEVLEVAGRPQRQRRGTFKTVGHSSLLGESNVRTSNELGWTCAVWLARWLLLCC